MVTVYDMTSGTLRQELEANRPSTPVEPTPDMRCEAEDTLMPMLQEVQWSDADNSTLPDHLAGLNVDSFISEMK